MLQLTTAAHRALIAFQRGFNDARVNLTAVNVVIHASDLAAKPPTAAPEDVLEILVEKPGGDRLFWRVRLDEGDEAVTPAELGDAVARDLAQRLAHGDSEGMKPVPAPPKEPAEPSAFTGIRSRLAWWGYHSAHINAVLAGLRIETPEGSHDALLYEAQRRCERLALIDGVPPHR